MAKNRTVIHLECSDCRNRNYHFRVGKKRAYGKLNLSKYCWACRKHSVHKETK